MALVRWDPYRSLTTLNRELENLFKETSFPEIRAADADQNGSSWLPNIDISESAEDYVLRAELPGVFKEDVKVTVTGELLTLCGDKKMEKESGERDVHRSERVFGSFIRSFNLPRSIDRDDVKAEFQNGVLTLRIPKAEGAKPKEIEIQ